MKTFIWSICWIGFMTVYARGLCDSETRLKNVPENPDSAEICPNEWQSLHRACYKFVIEPANWEDASRQCERMDAELLSIESWQEKVDFEEYFNTAHFYDNTLWWMGFKREKTTGVDWKWLSGFPLDPRTTPWANSKKINQPGKMCGMLDVTTGSVKVSTKKCSDEQEYICQLNSNVTTQFNTGLTTPFGGTRGATIVDDKEFGGHDGDDGKDGDIVGVSVVHGQKTSVTGGLYSSMKTVLSRNDLNTSPQVASAHTDNTTRKIPTRDLNTSPHVASAHTDNTTRKIPTRDLNTSPPVPFTQMDITTLKTPFTQMDITTLKPPTKVSAPLPTWESTTHRENVKDMKGFDKKAIMKTDLPPLTSTIQTSNVKKTEQMYTPMTEGSHNINRSREVSSTIPLLTESLGIRPDTPQPTMVNWINAYAYYDGCYIPATGGSLRNAVTTARTLYPDDLTSCPQIRIGSIMWSSVPAGQPASVRCARSQGNATFECANKPVCWKGEPRITECASKNLQAILRKTSVADESGSVVPLSLDETVEVSSMLVKTISTEETTMEDVIVIAHIITALTLTKAINDVMYVKQVEVVMNNIIKIGSALVSAQKSPMWEKMSQKDKVASASSLIVAIETITVSMADKINVPALIIIKDTNIEVEIRVVDIDMLERETQYMVYGSGESNNTFSIPVETLRSLSKGKLARAVFITHFAFSEIMSSHYKEQTTSPQPNKHISNHTTNVYSDVEMTTGVENHQNVEFEEERGPKVASYILSATVGGNRLKSQKLPESVSFTMKHIENVDPRSTALCSFWDQKPGMTLGFWSQDGCYLVSTNKTHTTCKCEHMTNFAILLDVYGMQSGDQVSKVHTTVLRLVTIIGCIISCIALIASWFTFQCFTSLQSERNSIHKNLAFTLLIAELLFVTGIDQAEHKIACSVIAGFLHFFFLAAFTWMFVEGLHIIFMLVQVFDASRSRLPYYYFIGYGVPSVVVGVSSIVFYDGYGTDKYCWLKTERYFIWSFAGPVALILLVNAVFLTYAMTTVCRHSDYVFNSKEKSNSSGIRAWVQGALALEVLLGLTWTLGYFQIDNDSLPLAYIFAVLNSLQGLFIFVFHCLLNKKTQKEYHQVVSRVVRRTPSSITTQSTITKRTHNTNNSHDLNNSPSNSQQKLNTTNSHSLA